MRVLRSGSHCLTAFLIREDCSYGSYAIRQRRGEPHPSPRLAWISDPAISRPDAAGHVVNDIAIRVGKDDVIFVANGREVTRRPVAVLDTSGIVGLRVTDHLDLRVEHFGVERFAS